LRARTLSNPNWQRDLPWLIHILDWYRPSSPGERRDLYDLAVKKARAYRAARMESEEDWDAFLKALDDYLWTIQRDHLDAVRKAGASGMRPSTQ
jgi:hypothetical protein